MNRPEVVDKANAIKTKNFQLQTSSSGIINIHGNTDTYVIIKINVPLNYALSENNFILLF